MGSDQPTKPRRGRKTYIPALLFLLGLGAIQLFNCGHWSHTYRKFAEEAGVRYLHAREPTRGCMHDFGKLLGNMDRAVPWEELRPAVCKAMDMVAESKAELKGWALPELTGAGY